MRRSSTTTGARSTTPRSPRSASRCAAPRRRCAKSTSSRAARARWRCSVAEGAERTPRRDPHRARRALPRFPRQRAADRGRARRRAAPRDRGAQPPLLRRRCADDLATPSTTRCSASSRRSRRAIPSSSRADSPTQRVGGARAGPISRRCGTPCRCCRFAPRPTPIAGAAAKFDARVRRDLGLAADAPPVEYMAELKFDGLAISLRYENGRSPWRRRAATARSARTSRPTSGRSARSRASSRARDPPPLLEVRGEVYMTRRDFAELNARQQAAGGKALHQSAQHRGRRRAADRSRDDGAAPAAVLRLRHRRDARLCAARDPARAARRARGVRPSGQRRPRASRAAPPSSRRSTNPSPRGAPICRSKSTASSTRSIRSRCRSSSGSCRASRAGRSRTSFRPRRWPPKCSASTSRSGARARSRRSRG